MRGRIQRDGRGVRAEAAPSCAASYQPLLLELPEYRLPNLRNLLLGLWERVRIFIGRVGTIILSLMVVLWFLASFPAPPAGATGPAIQYSIAGMLGRGLEVHLCADRIQLADLGGVGAGTCSAGSRGQRAGHRILDVGQ